MPVQAALSVVSLDGLERLFRDALIDQRGGSQRSAATRCSVALRPPRASSLAGSSAMSDTSEVGEWRCSR